MSAQPNIPELRKLRKVLQAFVDDVAHHWQDLNDKETHDRYHQLYDMAAEASNDSNFKHYVQPIGYWITNSSSNRLWREHTAVILSSATQLLAYIDDILPTSNEVVPMDTTQQLLTRILSTVSTIEGKDRIVAESSQIATAIQIDEQEVCDLLEVLEQEGKVQLWKSTDSYMANLTAKGRMALRDPNYKIQGSSSTVINVSGNYHGSIVNISSTLSEVSQTISNSQRIGQSEKDELHNLLEQLNEILQQAPASNEEEAEAVAEAARVLVEAATKEKPNKASIKITAAGLKQAAENIANVMPTVLPIAMEIAGKIQTLLP